MNEYENNMKEHKVTIVIGVVLIALLAIFIAKKRSHPSPESYDVYHVSEDKSDSIADILSNTSSAEEEHVAGVEENEISISIGIGGNEDVVDPVEVSVAPDEEEVVEPVLPQEQQPEEYATYVVKKGDTLSAIAQRFYGDASQWQRIAKANDLTDGHMVRVGMELVIPQQRKAEPSRPTRAVGPPRIEVAAEVNSETKKTRDYTVKKNDSLWKIAAAAYGDGNRWTTVFEANRDSIRNKNSLKPGQVIKLP